MKLEKLLASNEFNKKLREKYGDFYFRPINEKNEEMRFIYADGKTGLVDYNSLKELLPCEYYEVTECDESCGNLLLAFKDDSNRGKSNGLNLGYYGAIYDVDKKKFITDFRYCHVYEKHEDRIKVANYNAGSQCVLYGFINSDGKEVVPCKYRCAMDFRNSSAVVFNDWLRESGLIDKNGNELLPLQYSSYDFYIDENLIVFGEYKPTRNVRHMPECDTLFGVFNRRGENVIPCEYKNITYKHKSGYIQATKYNDEIDIFDKNGIKLEKILKENQKIHKISQVLQTAQTAEQKLAEIEKLICASKGKYEQAGELTSREKQTPKIKK